MHLTHHRMLIGSWFCFVLLTKILTGVSALFFCLRDGFLIAAELRRGPYEMGLLWVKKSYGTISSIIHWIKFCVLLQLLTTCILSLRERYTTLQQHSPTEGNQCSFVYYFYEQIRNTWPSVFSFLLPFAPVLREKREK